MKEKLVKLITIILVLVLVILSQGCSKSEENKEISVANKIEEVNTVEAFGVVKVKEKKNIIIDFPGYVETRQVSSGQKVSKGDLLITLNIDSFKKDIENKEHELMIMNIERQKIEKQVYGNIQQDPQIKKLINDLKYAEEYYEKEKKELESQRLLYNEGAISKETYNSYIEKVDELSKKVEDARYTLELNSDLKEADTKELGIQKERIKILENNINNFKSKLNKSYIDGNGIISDMENSIVDEISYEVGDLLTTDKKLLSLIDMDSIIIVADVPEEFIKDVVVGSRVVIVPLADKSKEYEGKVIKVYNRAIQKNGETIIPVEISIEDMEGFLLPNFNVDVTIYLE